MTTIKVPRSLRERIAARASQQQMTAAEVIAELLDEADRHARFEAIREAYASTDASYREETQAWDSLADDGSYPVTDKVPHSSVAPLRDVCVGQQVASGLERVRGARKFWRPTGGL
ncbi:hypothetical protein GCU56_20460 [Geodermatophilus sabuli]|uniref:Uncharacterized protein n=1 Tax=Geodermatophilus sabuli TaxID=1564158 RepID=A0A7K3W7R3_9ACTN|nr:hypothetical protein [Geodermatophilus sabuli]NEK60234.1 hypothetical protein [Geodermatophilus sabuli]